MSDTFKTALEEFVKLWQQRHDERFHTLGYDWKETYSISYGKRYAKIVLDRGNQKSVAGFVDLNNGDVLKAASWAAPAKKARGNIFSENQGMEAIDSAAFVRYLS